MRKFIYKISYFIFPFVLLFILNLQCYNQNEGDLIRLGYIYNNPSPKSKILSKFSLKKKYSLVSELNLKIKNRFQVLSIGDSFSDQGNLGYNNFLANEDISVIYVDRFLARDNPMQKLVELINSDFFDYIQTDYIVLQSAERVFVKRCEEIDFSEEITIDSLRYQINKYEKESSKYYTDFFSDDLWKMSVKIPLINIQYYFFNKPRYSQTYMVSVNRNNLFSNNPDNLLFYEGDINLMQYKNDTSKITICNGNLNKINELLSQKNIRLIVLICPDKYDLYYPYIKNNQKFEKSIFFNYFNDLSKDYLYLNAFEILSEELKKGKDIYYYDDSHWSPLGARLIAKELQKLINKN